MEEITTDDLARLGKMLITLGSEDRDTLSKIIPDALGKRIWQQLPRDDQHTLFQESLKSQDLKEKQEKRMLLRKLSFNEVQDLCIGRTISLQAKVNKYNVEKKRGWELIPTHGWPVFRILLPGRFCLAPLVLSVCVPSLACPDLREGEVPTQIETEVWDVTTSSLTSNTSLGYFDVGGGGHVFWSTDDLIRELERVNEVYNSDKFFFDPSSKIKTQDQQEENFVLEVF